MAKVKVQGKKAKKDAKPTVEPEGEDAAILTLAPIAQSTVDGADAPREIHWDEIAVLSDATLQNISLVTTNGNWRLVFDVPPGEREKIPAVTEMHQLAFRLTIARKRRRRMVDLDAELGDAG